MKLRWVNEEEERFSFSCSVMFSINLCFMLLWYGLRKGKILNALEVSRHAHVSNFSRDE